MAGGEFVSATHLEEFEVDQLLDEGSNAVGSATLAHLASCPNCRQRVRRARELELLMVAASGSLEATVQRPWRWRTAGLAISAVAAVVLFMVRPWSSSTASNHSAVESVAVVGRTAPFPSTDTPIRPPISPPVSDSHDAISPLARPNPYPRDVAHGGTGVEAQPLQHGPPTNEKLPEPPSSSDRILPPRSSPANPVIRGALVRESFIRELTLFVCEGTKSQQQAAMMLDSLRGLGRAVRRRPAKDSAQRIRGDVVVCPK